MRFRTALLLGTTLLIAAMVLAIAAAVSVVIGRSAEQTVSNDLRLSGQVFHELQAYRQSLLRSQSRVIAENSKLKAILTTDDISAETVNSVVMEIGAALGADLFLLTDSNGILLTDIADLDARGYDLSSKPLVASALRNGDAAGIWTDQDNAYQVQAWRVTFGDQPIGLAILGYQIDDRVAEAVQRQTGVSVVIELNGAPIAMSAFNHADQVGIEAIQRVLATARTQPTSTMLGGTRYMVMASPLASRDSPTNVRYVAFDSLARALAPQRKLRKILLLAAALALPLTMLGAIILARRLSRPIDDLVNFSQTLGSGDLRARSRPRGAPELRALSRAMNEMASGLAESRKQVAAKQRLEQEMELAARIQTSLLPRELAIEGLEIAAHMTPTTEVGGDYYDVIPTDDGCWIAVGDVAGHGVTAGLIMMMVQNVISALTRSNPDASPRDICDSVNRVLTDNVRRRLDRDEYVTLTLMRYHADGRVVFSGAHEDIVVWRARTDQIECIDTPGTWFAVSTGIGQYLVDTELQLEPGDVMVLYTDGVTEAMDEAHEQFGIERLCATIQDHARSTVDALCRQIVSDVDQWAVRQDDDVTVVVTRHDGILKPV